MAREVENRVKHKEGHKYETIEGVPYKVKNGALHHIEKSQDGNVEIPLCNFNAHIIERIIKDDGKHKLLCD